MKRRQFLKWLGIAPVAAIVAPKAAMELLAHKAALPVLIVVDDPGVQGDVDLEECIREAFARAVAKAEDGYFMHGGKQLSGDARRFQDAGFRPYGAPPSVHLKASAPITFKTSGVS